MARPTLAGVRRRILAFGIDALILSALVFGALAVVGVLAGPTIALREPSDLEPIRLALDPGRLVLDAIVGLALSAGYFAGSWIAVGATAGQRLLGIGVVTMSGAGRPGSRDALIRWALLGPLFAVATTLVGLWSPGLRASGIGVAVVWQVLLLVAVVRSGRGPHDRASGTIVVRRSRPEAVAGPRREPPAPVRGAA